MNMNNEHRKLEAENAFAMVLWKGVKIQLDKKSVRKSKKIVRNRVYAEALFNRMKIYAPRICLLRGIPIEKWFSSYYGLQSFDQPLVIHLEIHCYELLVRTIRSISL